MVTKQNIHKNNYNSHLIQLGWTLHFQTQLEQFSNNSFIPARVIGVRKNSFRVSNGKNEWLATLSGRFKYNLDSMYPVTGDWVLTTGAIIPKVLVRKNALTRGASGTHNKKNTHPQKKQIIAANLDTVFIVSGLDQDFNLRRIERYLTLIYNCSLEPVIILTKADLHQNPAHFISEVEAVAFGVPIYLVSALNDICLIDLKQYLSEGRTTTMVGSSGVGKSTLVNRLCGKTIQLTDAISTHIGKGKHTTSSRDLIVLQHHGGMMIDNPGIREITFWEVDNGIEATFPEIKKLAMGCRFVNCSHNHEPGCLVLKAVDEDKVSKNRLENYQKMKRELEYLSHRQHKSADRIKKERWKEVTLKIKAMKKEVR